MSETQRWVRDRIFDIKQDMAIVKAGGFFCQACLVGKPASEQSPDERYCQGCYEFLLEEAKMLVTARQKRPEWVPKKTLRKSTKEVAQVSDYMRKNMATVEDEKSKVAIIPPSVAPAKVAKRGPKPRALPVELITQWASEGIGYKRIAARLKVECGIEVGFRTIARVVKGERKQLALPV
ncbi:unnamed protein product [marine sediment metagenome]|uniref:Uncharacterized protein n=1 Tax=marine sediment metagenome TaxID=412755 RepID=X1JIE2_9ZZZZ